MVYTFFDKKSLGGAVTRAQSETLTLDTKSESDTENIVMQNQRPSDFPHMAKAFHRTQHLAEDLHKPVIRKFEKQKVHSSFMENIWDAHLANIQLINSFVFYNVSLTFSINTHGFFF